MTEKTRDRTSADEDLASVAIELREQDEMGYGEIAQRLPRDRGWVEAACEGELPPADALDEPTRTRMLTLAISAMAWMSSVSILLYVTGIWTKQGSIAIGVGVGLLTFIAYQILIRWPAVASWFDDGVPMDNAPTVIALTMILVTLVWIIWMYITEVMVF